VLNDVGRPGVGSDSDRNAATFLTRQTAIELPEMSKRDLADRILDEVRALRRPASIVDETAPVGNALLTAPVSATLRQQR
jgi:phosphopantothenoylcysteine decarboxylase/phosphopantothenate--cysteine ligase